MKYYSGDTIRFREPDAKGVVRLREFSVSLILRNYHAMKVLMAAIAPEDIENYGVRRRRYIGRWDKAQAMARRSMENRDFADDSEIRSRALERLAADYHEWKAGGPLPQILSLARRKEVSI